MNHRAPGFSSTVFSFAQWSVVGLIVGAALAYIVSSTDLGFYKWSMLSGATFAFLINIQPRGTRT